VTWEKNHPMDDGDLESNHSLDEIIIVRDIYLSSAYCYLNSILSLYKLLLSALQQFS
jgi:hypothetical protein